MKLKKQKKSSPSSLDVNAVTTVFKTANDFLTNLWKIAPIPTTETDGADEDDGLVLQSSKPKTSQSKFSKTYGEGTRAQSLEELHRKLEEMKGKGSYKDMLKKKGLKSRITKKARKEERALKKKLVRKKNAGPEFESKMEVKLKPTKPVYNSEGRMVFNKFDFVQSSALTNEPEKRATDPKALMHRIEKHNDKMKKLEMTGDADKIKFVKESYAWQTALQKSEGTKLKDDPILLAKTIKKNSERKKHRKEKWVERDDAVKKKMETKQKRRTANVENRKKKNKLGKLRKAAKKGKVIPGF